MRVAIYTRVSSVKPAEPRQVTLSPWQEVRGLVREITEDERKVRVVLEDGGDVIVVGLPAPTQGPPIQVGTTVAILRTDEPGREYLVRTSD